MPHVLSRRLTQRENAEQLRVSHNTVGGWLVSSSDAPKLTNYDPNFPEAATLNAIAAEIREQVKQEVRTEVGAAAAC